MHISCNIRYVAYIFAGLLYDSNIVRYKTLRTRLDVTFLKGNLLKILTSKYGYWKIISTYEQAFVFESLNAINSISYEASCTVPIMNITSNMPERKLSVRKIFGASRNSPFSVCSQIVFFMILIRSNFPIINIWEHFQHYDRES